MKDCANCGLLAAEVRDLCMPCLRLLPNVTRRVYEAGRTDTRRALEAIKLHRESVKALGGGKHSRG